MVNPKQMILDAQKGGYAIGCFNTSDLEITKAIVNAAEKLKSPVIIATSEKAIDYAGLENLAAVVKEAAKNTSVPIALHLDHGKSLAIVDRCLKAGYTSVMIDGSKLPLKENIALTYQATLHSHRLEIPCEGELGALGQAGETDNQLTNPEDVLQFTKKTEVDFLAVSIGSKHGAEGKERIDIELLKKIRSYTDLPLVLHGGSGVPDDDIKNAIQNGISKINIDTDIRHEFTKELREILAKYPEEKDFREILQKVMIEVQKLVKRKIKLFGSDGKV